MAQFYAKEKEVEREGLSWWSMVKTLGSQCRELVLILVGELRYLTPGGQRKRGRKGEVCGIEEREGQLLNQGLRKERIE